MISKKNIIKQIRNYLYEEIFKIIYKLIDDNKEDETNCKYIIEKIYNNDYISPFTIDIVSCLIEYFKEKVFNKYLKKALELEDNNFLANILETIKNKYQNINKNLVENIKKKYLDKINIEKNNANKAPNKIQNVTEVKDDDPIKKEKKIDDEDNDDDSIKNKSV